MFAPATLFSSDVGLDTRDPLQVAVVLLAGILLQVYGARLLVDGGSGLARRLGIHPMVIGSTVVAFGVSMPAFFISLWAANKGQGDLAAGTAVGGVLVNLGLVLGISALARPLRFRPQLFQADVPIMVAGAALAAFLMRNSWLGRFEGCLLIACLIGYTIFLWFSAQVEADTQVIREIEKDLPPPGPSKRVEIAQAVGGVILLIAGSRYLVKAAVSSAEMIHLSEPALALAFIPLVASAPKLLALFMAILRKEKDLAGGIIIGGCIFNCLGALGFAAFYRPILAPTIGQFDLGVMLLATLAVLPMMKADEKRRRAIGFALLVGYGLYLTQLLGRVSPGSL